MPKNITIYSRETCAPCAMLKRYLNNKGIQFTNRDISDDEAAAEAFAYSGYSIVPVTVVTNEDDTKKVITGFNLQQLIPAIQ